MTNKLAIELFRFNSKTDYLPYYTKHSMTFNEDETISSVLESIQNKEHFACEDINNCYVKINDIFLHSSEKINDVVGKIGTDIIVEPISTKRAIHDFIIDTSDYTQKLSLLNEFLSEDEMKHYHDQFILEYYASNTLEVNSDYIGDHVLLVASELIEKQPENKTKILEILSCDENGYKFHTALDNRLFKLCSEKKEKINKIVSYENTDEVFVDVENIEVKQSFENFNIATYEGMKANDSLKQLILKSNAKFVECTGKNDDLALHSMKINEKFSFKVAGKLLTEAIDKNADFLVVADEKYLDIFDKKQKQIEKVVGREIKLPIITLSQFVSLIDGEKDPSILGFDKHAQAITFL